MIKIKLTLITLFFLISIYAQKEKVIYVNENNNTFLIFENAINEGYMGSENYLFLYKKGSGTKIGTLKAVGNSKDTNLLVTTQNGLMFSYVIRYKENLTVFNYQIKNSDAINFDQIPDNVVLKQLDPTAENTPTLKVDNQDNTIIKEIKKPTDTIYNLQSIKSAKNLYIYNKEKYMRNICLNLVTKKPFYFNSKVFSNGLFFQLYEIIYNKDELYFSFLIENKRGLDYSLDFMLIQKTIKNLKKRINFTSEEITPLYVYQSPNVIKGGTAMRFVVVLKRFTINKKVLSFTLNEKNGERNISINVSSKQINNPNR